MNRSLPQTESRKTPIGQESICDMPLDGSQLRGCRQVLGLSQAKLAELCGVSQYLLSAFELDKAALSPSDLRTVKSALSNMPKVSRLVSRQKRYQDHRYVDVPRLLDRVRRAARTPENKDYLMVLEEIERRHTQERCNLSALSLFSGCGGFSLGFSAAGFRLKGHLEIDSSLRAIYRLNFPSCTEIGTDIASVTDAYLALKASQIGLVDIIIGGPPCQGFSLSGKRDVSDPRNALFKHYLRFVDVLRPKMAVLENVKLLTSMKTPTGQYAHLDICKSFQDHGYKIKCFEINAKDYGVPQHRERVLFVATRGDLKLEPSLPDPTHEGNPNMFAETSTYRTFADACSDLPFLESGQSSSDPLHKAVAHPAHVIEWLWDVPEGKSAHENEDSRKRPPSGYNTTYKRQVWNEPAGTVQTTFGMISGCRNVHPIATRSMTIREAARLQSFPDSYKFSGSLGVIRTGIGNAVPPLLAYRVAQHVRAVLAS